MLKKQRIQWDRDSAYKPPANSVIGRGHSHPDIHARQTRQQVDIAHDQWRFGENTYCAGIAFLGKH